MGLSSSVLSHFSLITSHLSRVHFSQPWNPGAGTGRGSHIAIRVFISHSSKDKPAVERLAEAEPDRADYQVDLAVSLMSVTQVGAGNREALLTRALSILNALKAEGRLAPVDEPKIAAVEQLLRGDA